MCCQEASAAPVEIAEGAVETERLVLELSEASTVVSRHLSVQDAEKAVELAEQNASWAVTMMSSANEVRRLIDSVAAVSEESAAATEEASLRPWKCRLHTASLRIRANLGGTGEEP